MSPPLPSSARSTSSPPSPVPSPTSSPPSSLSPPVRRVYTFVKEVGRGASGVAHLMNDDCGRQYIMKSIDIENMREAQLKSAINEIKVLNDLRHPYIVRYRESFIEGTFLRIVMDYCEGGDLHHRIQQQKSSRKKFKEYQILQWLSQAAIALKDMHSRHILHRDIKSQNIFLDCQEDRLRMGDFGICKVLENTMAVANTFVGTPYYMSPEIIQEQPYAWAADIWALGCVLFELATFRTPFYGAKSIGDLIRCLSADTESPSIPSGYYSEDLISLCRSMLQKKPEKRPTATNILQSSVVQTCIISMLTAQHDSTNLLSPLPHSQISQLRTPLPSPSSSLKSSSQSPSPSSSSSSSSSPSSSSSSSSPSSTSSSIPTSTSSSTSSSSTSASSTCPAGTRFLRIPVDTSFSVFSTDGEDGSSNILRRVLSVDSSKKWKAEIVEGRERREGKRGRGETRADIDAGKEEMRIVDGDRQKREDNVVSPSHGLSYHSRRLPSPAAIPSTPPPPHRSPPSYPNPSTPPHRPLKSLLPPSASAVPPQNRSSSADPSFLPPPPPPPSSPPPLSPLSPSGKESQIRRERREKVKLSGKKHKHRSEQHHREEGVRSRRGEKDGEKRERKREEEKGGAKVEEKRREKLSGLARPHKLGYKPTPLPGST